MKVTYLFFGVIVANLSIAALAQKQVEPAPPAFEQSSESAPETDTHDPFAPDTSVPKLIQVQVEYISLPHPALTKLLYQSKSKSTDAGALRDSLQKMVLNDEAEVMETQIIIGRSGQKSSSESIAEFIYPSEYEAIDWKTQTDELFKQAMGCSFPFNPATPTAFETRNVGSTLEVEPTLGQDDVIIDLRIAPEIVWHTGETTWQEWKDSLGNVSKVQMPNFYTLRLNTVLMCIREQYVLAGVLSPKDENGDLDRTQKVMVFVKCNVLTVK